jgi:ribose 5-phosphate isomerase B
VAATPDTNTSAIRVHIGGDHAAYELKTHLIDWLSRAGYLVEDHGPHVYDPQDDYPPFVLRAAVAVASDPGSMGVVLGGSGNGEQIAANKVNGIRAALVWNEDTAVLARQHNDANVISLGARQHDLGRATGLLQAFLDARFSGESRHQQRIAMLTQFEATGSIPPLPTAPVTPRAQQPAPNP